MAAVGVTSPPATLSAAAAAVASRRCSTNRAAFLRLRCSADSASAAASPEEEAAVAGAEGATSGRPPYSLISSANVQKALRGLAITDADHYGRLGISKKASYDEVKVAYERKCEELSSKGLDEEEVNKELELMKESFAILSTEEERRLYDWSLARSERPERYVWPFEVDALENPTDPPPQEPEDVGPTRLVGYFFLAWFILAAALSLSLY